MAKGKKPKNAPREEQPSEEMPKEDSPDEAGIAVEEMPLEEQVAFLRQQLEETERKVAEHYDQWLRAVAELRNYKKRVEQEREALSREANANLLSHLLPTLDDFERAMDSLPDKELRQFTWIEGIQLIYHRLLATLQQHGLQRIEAVGQPFDPYIHDAILFEEVPSEQDQLILEELQRGYKLHGRLLRPTLVKVGRAALEPTPEESIEQPVEEKAVPPSLEEPQEEAEPVESV